MKNKSTEAERVTEDPAVPEAAAETPEKEHEVETAQGLMITSAEMEEMEGAEVITQMQDDPAANQKMMFEAAKAKIAQKEAVNQISNNIVAANGEELTDEEKKSVEDLLASLAKVDNFVIYADTYSSSTHIDGNIAVNEYSNEQTKKEWVWNPETQQTDIIEKQQDYLETIKGTGSNYSYIGSSKAEDGMEIGSYDNQGTATNVATLIVGDPDIKIQNNNGKAEVVDLSDVDLNDLDNEETKQQVKDVFGEALADRGIDADEFLDHSNLLPKVL